MTAIGTGGGEQEENHRWEEKVPGMDSDEEWLRRRRRRAKTLITADVIVIVLQEGMRRAQVDGGRRDSRASERAREKTIFLLTPHLVISPEEVGESVAGRGFACG